MKWSLALVCCVCFGATSGNDTPRITFIKSFPGSAPAYLAVSLDKSGAGDYKEAQDDDKPVHFQLTDSEAAGIFDLAEKLGYFDHPLESGLKVAFMGEKTFRYENGAVKHEVKFNYSEVPEAQVLADWFERISESEQLLVTLEVSAKYDRLGVDKAVLQLEAAYDRKRLVATTQYLPMLDRIAKNEAYIHQARLRAASLADQIRAPK